MSRWSKVIILSSLLFFALGVAWGLSPFLRNFGVPIRPLQLSVICPKKWIPAATIQRAAKKLNVTADVMDFSSWSEFVRLVANSQGHADVICFHSFLAKDLIASNFLDGWDYSKLSNYKNISVDFRDVKFDPQFHHTLPLFWGVNGFVIKKNVKAQNWSDIWPQKGDRLSLLYPNLELLWRMSLSGLDMDEWEKKDGMKHVERFVHGFFHDLSSTVTGRQQIADKDLSRYDIIQMANGPAADFLKKHDDWSYWIPSDGVSFWMGLAAVGRNSHHKTEARLFINELLDPQSALDTHKALGYSVVQSSLDASSDLLPMQRSSDLRDIPLDRLRFPNVPLEIVPRWEHLVADSLKL